MSPEDVSWFLNATQAIFSGLWLSKDFIGGPEVLDLDEFSQQTVLYMRRALLCGRRFSKVDQSFTWHSLKFGPGTSVGYTSM